MPDLDQLRLLQEVYDAALEADPGCDPGDHSALDAATKALLDWRSSTAFELLLPVYTKAQECFGWGNVCSVLIKTGQGEPECTITLVIDRITEEAFNGFAEWMLRDEPLPIPVILQTRGSKKTASKILESAAARSTTSCVTHRGSRS